jgi:haloalkane dehalogenase
MKKNISPDFPYQSHFIDINGSKIHYVDEGSGNPILFLHGMPTSSYVWRNIIPHLISLGRCIAPDLIGMGKSEKPNITYSISDHIQYVEKFINAMELKNITLVMHGWGSIIGFDYAMKHENNIKGLIFYESYLRPLDGEDFSLPLQEQLFELKAQKNCHDLILNSPYFVEKMMPEGMMRTLSEKEMNYYREPFLQKGSGKPLQQYLQELQDNTKVNEIISTYSKKLKQSKAPKLMLYSVPGFITTMDTVMWAKDNFLNLEMVDVGEAMHFAQENDPFTMGEAISVWLQGVEQSV